MAKTLFIVIALFMLALGSQTASHAATEKDIIWHYRSTYNLSAGIAEKRVNTVIKFIAKSLINGERVSIKRFGLFLSKRKRKTRPVTDGLVLKDIRTRTGLNHEDARKFLDIFIAQVGLGLKRDNFVKITGFGLFRVKIRPAGPVLMASGKYKNLPEKARVWFEPSRSLVNAVRTKVLFRADQVFGEFIIRGKRK